MISGSRPVSLSVAVAGFVEPMPVQIVLFIMTVIKRISASLLYCLISLDGCAIVSGEKRSSDHNASENSMDEHNIAICVSFYILEYSNRANRMARSRYTRNSRVYRICVRNTGAVGLCALPQKTARRGGLPQIGGSSLQENGRRAGLNLR